MAGRSEIQVYQYNSNGKYITKYDNMSIVKLKYYSNTQYPIFRDNSFYHILPDNSVIFKERVNRDNVKRLFKRLNSPFLLEKNTNRKEIELLNIDNEVIATFINISFASKLLNMSSNHIHQMLNTSKNEMPKNKLGISFRYK